MLPSEIEKAKGLYDAAIKYVDDAIGWLLDKANSRLENTIIIITADHGDEFGEHGKFTHLTLYDGIIHVPLIITGPRVKAGAIVREQVSLFDLAPTIVDLLGLGVVHAFRGESLLPLIKGKTKMTRNVVSTFCHLGVKERLFACRSPKWKYICAKSTDTITVTLAEEFYNLEDDPGEAVNLNSLKTEEILRLKERAVNQLSQFQQAKIEERTTVEKERIKARIKKLGKSQS
jgi:arylsulfatase A-like enzyme